ncbi:MAG: hypothetical protein WC005_01730 [Candidatus Nanopelagicales bacterium]
MGRRWGARSIASLLIFVIAMLLTPVAVIGHWGHRTVTDTEQYLATVGPLASDPVIQQAISDEVTKALVAKIDTETLVSQFLGNFVKNPMLTDKLSAPIAAGVNGLIGQAVLRLIESPAFETIWLKTNEAAQRSAVALLEGKPSGIIQTNGDKVVLDTTSLLVAVQQKLVESGLSVADNVTIPSTGHQITLFETNLLPQLQLIYQFTSPVLQWLPLLVAALFALSIALARRRPRTVLTLGVVLAATALVLLFAMSFAQTATQVQLTSNGLGLALGAFWTTFFAYLMNSLQAVLLLGVVIAGAGWFAGGSRPASRIRDHICQGLHELGAPIPAGVNTFVRAYSLFLRWAVAIVLVLLLVTFDSLSLGRTFWLLALGVLLFAVIEACNRPDREVFAVEGVEIDVETP